MRSNSLSEDKCILRGIEVSKHFGGVRAVQNLNFALHEGEILGLIGPNGSGKTTLFNVISGIYPPTNGQVFFKGESIENLMSHEVASLGISRTFQNVRLFKRLSVLMNVKVGAHLKVRSGLASTLIRSPGFRHAEREANERARRWLEFVGMDHRSDELAQNLPFGEQKLLELARALAGDPMALLLDEPAAGLNPHETERLAEVITQLRDMEYPIFIVEHNMHLVMSICDFVVAINFGKKIAEGSPVEIQDNRAVQEAYLGSDWKM